MMRVTSLNSDAAFSSWESAPVFFENFISGLVRVELWLIMTLSMFGEYQITSPFLQLV